MTIIKMNKTKAMMPIAPAAYISTFSRFVYLAVVVVGTTTAGTTTSELLEAVDELDGILM